MKRREFLVTSALGSVAVLGTRVSAATADGTAAQPSGATRKILIAGGGFNTAFIRYMATLTGKKRPRICYLPTASADSPNGIISWFRNCAPLDIEPHVQESFIASPRQTKGWDEVLLSGTCQVSGFRYQVSGRFQVGGFTLEVAGFRRLPEPPR